MPTLQNIQQGFSSATPVFSPNITQSSSPQQSVYVPTNIISHADNAGQPTYRSSSNNQQSIYVPDNVFDPSKINLQPQSVWNPPQQSIQQPNIYDVSNINLPQTNYSSYQPSVSQQPDIFDPSKINLQPQSVWNPEQSSIYQQSPAYEPVSIAPSYLPAFGNPSKEFFGTSSAQYGQVGLTGNIEIPNTPLQTEADFKNFQLKVNEYNQKVEKYNELPFGYDKEDLKGLQQEREYMVSYLDTTPGISKTQDGSGRIIPTTFGSNTNLVLLDPMGKENLNLKFEQGFSRNPMPWDNAKLEINLPATGGTVLPKTVADEQYDKNLATNEYLGYLQRANLGTEDYYGKNLPRTDVSQFSLTGQQKIDVGTEFGGSFGDRIKFMFGGDPYLKGVLQERMDIAKQNQLQNINQKYDSKGNLIIDYGEQLRYKELQGDVGSQIENINKDVQARVDLQKSMLGVNDNFMDYVKTQNPQSSAIPQTAIQTPKIYGTSSMQYGEVDQQGNIISAGLAYNNSDIEKLNKINTSIGEGVTSVNPKIEEMKKLGIKLDIDTSKYQDITQLYQSGTKDLNNNIIQQWGDVEKGMAWYNPAKLPLMGITGVQQNFIMPTVSFLAESGQVAKSALVDRENLGTDIQRIKYDMPNYIMGGINTGLMVYSFASGFSSTITKLTDSKQVLAPKAIPVAQKAIQTGETLGVLDVVKYQTTPWWKSALNAPITKELGMAYGIPAALQSYNVITGKENIGEGFRQTIRQGSAFTVLGGAMKTFSQAGGEVATWDLGRQIEKGLKGVTTSTETIGVTNYPKSQLEPGVIARADMTVTSKAPTMVNTKYGAFEVKVKGGITNELGEGMQGGANSLKTYPMRSTSSYEYYYRPVDAMGRVSGGVPFEGKFGSNSFDNWIYGGEAQGVGSRIAFQKTGSYLSQEQTGQIKNYLQDRYSFTSEQSEQFLAGKNVKGTIINPVTGKMDVVTGEMQDKILGDLSKKGFDVFSYRGSGQIITNPTSGLSKGSFYTERGALYNPEEGFTFAFGKNKASNIVELKGTQSVNNFMKGFKDVNLENPVMSIREADLSYSRLRPVTTDSTNFRQTIFDTGAKVDTNVIKQKGTELFRGYGAESSDLEIGNIIRRIGPEQTSAGYYKAGTTTGQFKLGVSDKGVPLKLMQTESYGMSIGTMPVNPQSGISVPFSQYDNIGTNIIGNVESVPVSILKSSSVPAALTKIAPVSDIPIALNIKGVSASPQLVSPSVISLFGIGSVGSTKSITSTNTNLGFDSNIKTISNIDTMFNTNTDMSSGTVQLLEPLKISGVTEIYKTEKVTKPQVESIAEIGTVNKVTSVYNTDIAKITGTDISSVQLTTPFSQLVPPIITIPGPVTPTPVVPNWFNPVIPPFVPGQKQLSNSQNGRYGVKRGRRRPIVDPLADYRIYFQRKFGYMGDTTGYTKTINVLNQKYGTGADIGDFGKRVKELI